MPNHRQGWRGGWNDGWKQQHHGRWPRDAKGTEHEVKEGWSCRTRHDSGGLQDEGWSHSWRSWPQDKGSGATQLDGDGDEGWGWWSNDSRRDSGWSHPWRSWPQDKGSAAAQLPGEGDEGWGWWSNDSRRDSGGVQEEGWSESWRQWSEDEGFKTKLPQKQDEGLDQQLQSKAAGRLFARALRSATIPQRRVGPEPSEPSETATVAPAPRETWAACPKESDIHSQMCGTGRVDPFDVGYACTSIPDHQPDGRAAKQPLSRVWQSAKVLDDGKMVYIGHEQPIEVFRAKLANGREQLLTTEGWKLYILQRSALARYPKKAVIAPKILMDEDVINEKIQNADIPDDVDATCMTSEDGSGPGAGRAPAGSELLRALEVSAASLWALGALVGVLVFRAKLANGREQLLTTEGWKLYILQRSALARYPKKAVIAPKILMDEDDINEKIQNADIPDDVDGTCSLSFHPSVVSSSTADLCDTGFMHCTTKVELKNLNDSRGESRKTLLRSQPRCADMTSESMWQRQSTGHYVMAGTPVATWQTHAASPCRQLDHAGRQVFSTWYLLNLALHSPSFRHLNLSTLLLSEKAGMTAGSSNIMVVGLVMPKARCPLQTVACRYEMCCGAARGTEHEVKEGSIEKHFSEQYGALLGDRLESFLAQLAAGSGATQLDGDGDEGVASACDDSQWRAVCKQVGDGGAMTAGSAAAQLPGEGDEGQALMGWSESWRQWSEDEGFKTKLPQKQDEGLDQQLQSKAAGRLFARALRSATIPQRRVGPEPSEPSETATVAPAPRETWAACPKESDIHSQMCGTGRVDPFDVGYACTSIPDHQPDGRAAKQPLSRVWQSAKVLDDGKMVYIGHEQPIEVFRAKLANGREQLLTTEGWKLYILQRSALARYPKKAVIAPKILMDEDVINEKIQNADIPDDVDATYMKSEDGTRVMFSWRDVLASKSKAK
ncbi:unnamed protein product [Symbiodinium sp. CCMP2592]|nr:unnamed protein product [Symbiodinium sp. CCMP2592]